jgi:hypothetical protein
MQIRGTRNTGNVTAGPLRTATLAPAMKSLYTLCLLAASTCIAGTALAQTATPAPTGSDCIPLQDDHQLVRKNADRNILLRNGADYYIVHFTASCSSAAYSKKLDFVTHGNEGQLCGAGASKLRTDSTSCVIEKLEPITEDAFKLRAKR